MIQAFNLALQMSVEWESVSETNLSRNQISLSLNVLYLCELNDVRSRIPRYDILLELITVYKALIWFDVCETSKIFFQIEDLHSCNELNMYNEYKVSQQS